MNEIIRSIWDKAAIALKDVELGRTENRARLMEKFAELLIYECVGVLEDEVSRLDTLERPVSAQTLDIAQILIKRHFMVE